MADQNHFMIRKVAVLGAGVMGAQIAAQLTNANVKTILFDLAAKEGDPNGIVRKAIANLKKLKPSPMGIADKADLIEVANYENDLAKLQECDLIIEAIAERLDWKEALYQKIAPFVAANSILVSNTSGLSINKLAEVLPQALQNRFCGVHFFNPPRYMHLVEIIPSKNTDQSLLPQLETFLVSTLGKGVVYAKDTPNFIANRVGVFSMLATMHHAEQFAIDFEVVDALTGPAIGRPKSATFRTTDVVGLDTMAHVVKTLDDNLPEDPWHAYYQVPAWLQQLIQLGALGQKTGAGIYKKAGQEIQVIDVQQKNYRTANKTPNPEVLAILKIKNPTERFAALRQSNLPEAQFLWACFRDLFHYSAFHLQEIANTTRDVDFALRWGFGWQQGPFELWQTAGWQQVLNWINEDIQANKAMAKVALPAWVNQLENNEVYTDKGAYSPANKNYVGRSNLPVYRKQLFPEKILGEKYATGTVIFENEGLQFWHQGDDIGIVSFKTKMNTVNAAVLEGLYTAIDHAEKNCQGLVIWQNQGSDFSAGANLLELVQGIQTKGPAVAEALIKDFQKCSMRLRYSLIPTVAAVRGRALGGGCELPLHCDRVVAAYETYMGLVEIGVGLLPAGGGTKEFALRAAQESKTKDVLPNLIPYFKQIAMAEVIGSAEEGFAKHFFRRGDVTVMNANEILFVAKQQVQALAASGYRPMLPSLFPVAGKEGIATLQMQLVNMREGGFISDYDYFLATKIAEVICGGNIESGSLVTEEWLLRLELDTFIELLSQEKTQQRIKYLLETGKPLRN